MVAGQLVDMKLVVLEVLAVADLMHPVEQELQDKEIKGGTEITPALVIITQVVVAVLVLLA
jgi:hypothetical protein